MDALTRFQGCGSALPNSIRNPMQDKKRKELRRMLPMLLLRTLWNDG